MSGLGGFARPGVGAGFGRSARGALARVWAGDARPRDPGFVCDAGVGGRRLSGALDLFRRSPGPLDADQLAAALVAAELAGLPMLDLFSADLQAAIEDPDSDAWGELYALSRAEVSQATGALMAGSTSVRLKRWCGCAARLCHRH